jgi:hypothetical protein
MAARTMTASARRFRLTVVILDPESDVSH